MKGFKYNRLLIVITTLLLLNGCYEEQLIENIDGEPKGAKVLRINQIDGFVDIEDQLIFFTLGADTIQSFSSSIHFYDYESMQLDGKDLINDQVNELGDITVNHLYEIVAIKDSQVDTFKLLFTRLPLIQIISDYEIVDEPKICSNISIQYCDENKDSRITYLFNSYAGIEYRGASSLRYDKKSYGIELWKNEFEDDLTTSLLGMHPGEDWILDAMYIDDLRMRNKISFELWEKMSAVPLEDMKPDVNPGIHCEFVELFINNKYYGLYTLDEKLDEKLLHYAAYQNELGGVLYKAIHWSDGSTKFNTYLSDPPANSYWDGWELIYPKESFNWEPLANLRKHIVFSSDDNFKNEIESLFDIDNAINYFLFLNLTLTADNSGKNTFLAKYTDESRFFYMPWDIEASWGLFWNREKIEPEGIITNNLFQRLIETNAADFNSRLRDQWFVYRNSIFSEDALLEPINEYYLTLKNSGVIDRENSRWIINIDHSNEHEYIVGWIKERLEYLDEYFE